MKRRIKGQVKLDEPPDPVGEFMMRQAPHLLEPGQLDIAATTIFLIKDPNFRVWSATLKNLDAGVCHIDAKLVSDLYQACPPGLKPAFASTFAVAHLKPADFHPIFEDAYAREMSALERQDLACNLGSFFHRNPAEVPRYRALILELLRSRQLEPALMGINLAKRIDDLGQEDLELLERRLSARYFPHREAALHAFQKLLERYRTIHPRVLDFCMREKLVEKFVRMRREDPDSDVRIYYAKQTLEAYDRVLWALHGRRRRSRKKAGPSSRGGPKSQSATSSARAPASARKRRAPRRGASPR
ncbi:MAG TPA: hypothetical protein VK447_07525 [Myxococcaceae bacterium]|nr:hypothetical protein [Myxococcaceae bacterium]